MWPRDGGTPRLLLPLFKVPGTWSLVHPVIRVAQFCVGSLMPVQGSPAQSLVLHAFLTQHQPVIQMTKAEVQVLKHDPLLKLWSVCWYFNYTHCEDTVHVVPNAIHSLSQKTRTLFFHMSCHAEMMESRSISCLPD